MRINATVFGDREIIARIQELKAGSQKRILRPAVAKAVRPMGKSMKRHIPTRKSRDIPAHWVYKGKQMRKAVGTKVKTYRGGVVGIIGPRTGFDVVVGTRTEGPHKGQPIPYDPVNVAHVVDQDTARTEGKRFREKTIQETKGEVSRIMHDETRVQYQREVARLASRGK